MGMCFYAFLLEFLHFLNILLLHSYPPPPPPPGMRSGVIGHFSSEGDGELGGRGNVENFWSGFRSFRGVGVGMFLDEFFCIF